MLTDPEKITHELALAESATNQVINEATFGTPTKLIQFRNLIRSLREQMAQADQLTDWNILELRNEILGLPDPRLEFLIIELFNFKAVVIAVLVLVFTIAVGLQEDRRLSTSGRI